MTDKVKDKIIRAGCFVGEVSDPNALCQKPDCRLAPDCIWKKKAEEVKGLGTMPVNRGVIISHG